MRGGDCLSYSSLGALARSGAELGGDKEGREGGGEGGREGGKLPGWLFCMLGTYLTPLLPSLPPSSVQGDRGFDELSRDVNKVGAPSLQQLSRAGAFPPSLPPSLNPSLIKVCLCPFSSLPPSLPPSPRLRSARPRCQVAGRRDGGRTRTSRSTHPRPLRLGRDQPRGDKVSVVSSPPFLPLSLLSSREDQAHRRVGKESQLLFPPSLPPSLPCNHTGKPPTSSTTPGRADVAQA